jgi:hypothetical protein
VKMAERPETARDRKPTVRIIACEADEREIQPILWGLEEEGIPAEVENVSSGEAVVLAKQAAHMSALNVGIAVDGIKGEIVLHHRDLAGEYPLFTLAMPDASKAQLRVLGANAARLVKGDPLIFIEDLPADDPVDPPAAGIKMNSNEMLDLIVRSVLEVLAKE